jgi:ankyrin repeat protein
MSQPNQSLDIEFINYLKNMIHEDHTKIGDIIENSIDIIKIYPDIIKYLINANIDINEKYGTSEMSFLHHAINFNHLDEIKYLLANGANVNASTQSGYTPLHYAVMNYKAQIPYRNDPLLDEEADRRILIIKYLLDQGADRELTSCTGHTAINIARLNWSVDIAEFIETYEPIPTKGVNCDD